TLHSVAQARRLRPAPPGTPPADGAGPPQLCLVSSPQRKRFCALIAALPADAKTLPPALVQALALGPRESARVVPLSPGALAAAVRSAPSEQPTRGAPHA
ncbi:hypothetical protein, partial [Ideonella sp.]|uniref:hypothetical protein n=1 Tax=Ideonella sp. TaxID=1929293 RepID=UPI003BB54A49